MDRDQIEKLIERVEQGSGPDRQDDAEIMFALFAQPVGEHDDGGPRGYLWPEDNPSWNFGIRFPGRDREWVEKARDGYEETLVIERDGAAVLMNALRVPELTGSIDAAVALTEQLVGPCDKSLIESDNVLRTRGHRFACDLYDTTGPDGDTYGRHQGIGWEADGSGNSFERAILSAMLHALLQRLENGGGDG